MKTRRVLSNISFNTPSYFRKISLDLVADGYFDYIYWICHHADTDDKKDHIHFLFQPSKSLETSSIIEKYLQFDISFPADNSLSFVLNDYRPLKPTFKFNPVNSLDDWLLYCCHNVDYLSSKGLKRNYYYKWTDFQSTDSDSLIHDINNIDYTKIGRLSFLREGALYDVPFYQLIQDGKIPIQYRAQYEAQYNALRRFYKAQKYTE